jgi:hypothetical protein
MWCIINGQNVEFESYNLIKGKNYNNGLRLLQMEKVHIEDWNAIKKRENIVMFEKTDHYLCYKCRIFSHQVFPIFGKFILKKFRLIFTVHNEYKADKNMIQEALELKELAFNNENPEVTVVKKEIVEKKYTYINAEDFDGID